MDYLKYTHNYDKMIKLIIGGVGTGKSISIVKEIIDRNRKCFVNFSIKYPYATRLKLDNIVIDEIKGYKKNGEAITKQVVNWDFWNNLKNSGEEFDIYIDEAHNIANSRRSMSTWNKNFNDWLAQIRKILGSSEKSNLYIITQRVMGIDTSIRDLCHEITYMKKVQLNKTVKTPVLEHGRRKNKILPVVLIFKHHFKGEFCLDAFELFMRTRQKSYRYKSYFVANKYYQFYESYELIDFGNGVYV